MGILTSSADVLGILYELYGAQHGPGVGVGVGRLEIFYKQV
jgi:hypothetical protein